MDDDMYQSLAMALETLTERISALAASVESNQKIIDLMLEQHATLITMLQGELHELRWLSGL